MIRAILFDLDDTLVVDVAAASAAFTATAHHAAARVARVEPVEPDRLADAARRWARELWHGGPEHEVSRRIGISSSEGLWASFEGESPDARRLRDWAPSYRRETWRLALAEQGIEDDGDLAAALGERFGIERRARHQVFAEAPAVLAELGRSYALGLVTNGDPSLQREKLAASGLAGHFDAVVISGELGIGKPAPEPFRRALELLGIGDGGNAVMVGDNPVNDVAGALDAGLRAVWVDRGGADASLLPSTEIPGVASLTELPGVIAGL